MQTYITGAPASNTEIQRAQGTEPFPPLDTELGDPGGRGKVTTQDKKPASTEWDPVQATWQDRPEGGQRPSLHSHQHGNTRRTSTPRARERCDTERDSPSC